ncbi:MAG: hypothetical protein GAK30_01314 [Paracidovorax wautersii]|uniref:DNA polymerase III, chi subunit n=1 Tax=Paracidovorax wautersii TaxID=1177982 RepID=A0A7V8FQ28_9BURK|nr:MAG: hypothetical protein GAK30_01314 [Paracidovorax wautersii]
MTRIDFHSNVTDPCQYACRLLRKASSQGARVLVTVDAPLLAPLDQALWALGDTEFVPHCRSSDDPDMLAASPIVLHDAAGGALPAIEVAVLVNLSRQLPQGFERFERLIEILPTPEHDAEGVALARQRWKHYKDRGYALKNHVAGG